jgi:hypothetical protein
VARAAHPPSLMANGMDSRTTPSRMFTAFSMACSKVHPSRLSSNSSGTDLASEGGATIVEGLKRVAACRALGDFWPAGGREDVPGLEAVLEVEEEAVAGGGERAVGRPPASLGGELPALPFTLGRGGDGRLLARSWEGGGRRAMAARTACLRIRSPFGRSILCPSCQCHLAPSPPLCHCLFTEIPKKSSILPKRVQVDVFGAEAVRSKVRPEKEATVSVE